LDTGDIELLLEEAKRPEEGLFSIEDIQFIIAEGITSTHFT
jgi:hypothetical protein